MNNSAEGFGKIDIAERHVTRQEGGLQDAKE